MNTISGESIYLGNDIEHSFTGGQKIVIEKTLLFKRPIALKFEETIKKLCGILVS
jgi:hypothetical protein